MTTPAIIIYVCRNSVAAGTAFRTLEQRAQQAVPAVPVAVREVPCSGKMDIGYLMKAFEGGARGVAAITCPLGRCRLAEGNYRAQRRAQTLARLLEEIGLGAQRVLLLHCANDREGRDVAELIDQAVARLSALPGSPLEPKLVAVETEPK